MKVLIGGTPLESMGWQRDLGKVRIVMREGTSCEDQFQFLLDLINSAAELRADLLEAWVKETERAA
ncbi:hypothetical protein [Mesorhizobium sp.]|uniref:hypothetical protein n=1 Tax=Mesorhizobium sp. TaxID=1871066 RepID=UPI000FE4372C|nr:hypothetical protein [Mesorhizobium sp.]RWJ03444.1 MAG: hypothetical protein EOR24_32195 [Mesorhizobium sp.]